MVGTAKQKRQTRKKKSFTFPFIQA
uniref:Uncharacterized protein n=1 Tax=Rhizophora mucronata TaxID=61149 RepID=A0A2P2N826_RHIMU